MNSTNTSFQNRLALSINALFTLLLLFSFQVYSQTTKRNDIKLNGQISKYKTVNLGKNFYLLKNYCEEVKKIDGCWKLGLMWDAEKADPSLVTRSKMRLYYFPKASLNCDKISFYEISPDKGGGWMYKDANISISVEMEGVETGFSYQLSKIRIINKSVENCNGPRNYFFKEEVYHDENPTK